MAEGAESGRPPEQERPKLPDTIPVGYGAIQQYYQSLGRPVSLFLLRAETMRRIEGVLDCAMVAYVAKTNHVGPGVPASIDHGDLLGFTELIAKVEADCVDVFLVSNGGSAEATERIVRLLRGRFKRVRFIVVWNAFSAATLMSFAGDEIIMDSCGTLGPIDPQLNGIPARAILRGFETVEQRLKKEGPGALTAYMPLISKYDLHTFEMCKDAEELSRELARSWLSQYMFHVEEGNERVEKVVEFFSDYDIHKSHGRSIDRQIAVELGLKVTDAESIDGLAPLLRSLSNQYEYFFDQAPFFKLYEDVRGTNWGRRHQDVKIQLPGNIPGGLPIPGPGAPQAVHPV